jgi:hypothetical protein
MPRGMARAQKRHSQAGAMIGVAHELREPGNGETATPHWSKSKFGRTHSRMPLRNRKGLTTFTWHCFTYKIDLFQSTGYH